MTRNAMVKKIGDVLGVRELDGVRHIDRPSWWLRQMFSEVRSKGELVECPKVDQEIRKYFCSRTRENNPEVGDPDCMFCENF